MEKSISPIAFFSSILLIVSSFTVVAQTIPNASFDSLYIGGIDRILHWVTSDGVGFGSGSNGLDTIQPLNPATFYDAQGLQFSEVFETVYFAETPLSASAIRISSDPTNRKTNGDYFESFVLNGDHFTTDDLGYIDYSKCGTPFPFRPTNLKGQYKFESDDPSEVLSGKCVVLLKRYVDGAIDTVSHTISTGDFLRRNEWTEFQMELFYITPDVPDSIVVVFMANSDPSKESTFYLDELELEFSENGIEPMDDFEGSLYPNPTSDILILEFPKEVYERFDLLDNEGRLLISGQRAESIDLSQFAPQQLYLRLFSQENKTRTYRIVKN